MQTFRDLLRTDSRLNPFNPKFDITYLQEIWTESVPKILEENLEDIQALHETCNVLSMFNHIYTLESQKIDEIIALTALTRETLISLLLAQHNASYLWVIGQFTASFQGRTDFDFTETFGHRTTSRDPGVGDINTGGGLATLVDTLQIALNFVKDKSAFNLNASKPTDIAAIHYTDQLVKEANLLFGFKSTYEAVIWNGGYIRKRGKNDFLATFPDRAKLILEEIGRFRLQMDSLAMNVKLQQILTKQGETNLGFDPAVRKHVCIKSIQLTEGAVTYELQDGVDVKELDDTFSFFAALETFYPYLNNVPLPAFSPLTMCDIILLFQLTTSLFSKVADNTDYAEKVTDLKTMFGHPYKIAKDVLGCYLLERSTYNQTAIDTFLMMITKPQEEYYNFWNKPLAELGEDLLVSLLPITVANHFHLLDRWLEQGGFNLEKRGRMLESHVKSTLREILTTKNFEHHIPETQRFRIAGEKEEIDLIINLKSVVIIAEVKCIKYPMEIRDYYNNYERLKRGAAQVVRKADFFSRNSDGFKSITRPVDGKKLIRLVVTNYPIFAGCLIDDIPVIDFHWLEGYCKHNYLIEYSASGLKGQLTSQIEQAKILYGSEDEFNANFEMQMRNPVIIEQLKSSVSVKETRMTFSDFPIGLYYEHASFD